ncbi:hypothetical protein K469DRAFT_789651 [Zopfia rhizophila CBS 207.26]|uniref:Uncharacterized protein n=1 Tax=Zopfia rhizophila CBS 207.26 TaxID=1314779 RepID=A0A6A6END0_9PEZI|nr:hypothetical protein K469DRAFT_789651 [Zopfia rhizophila CBS 207.26]
MESRELMQQLHTEHSKTNVRFRLRYRHVAGWAAQARSTAMLRQPSTRLDAAASAAHVLPFNPNLLATIIAAPEGHYRTDTVRKRMRHHATDFDQYLTHTDETARGWSEQQFITMLSAVLPARQALRQNNEEFLEKTATDWENLVDPICSKTKSWV